MHLYVQFCTWVKLPKWQGGSSPPLAEQNLDYTPILEEQTGLGLVEPISSRPLKEGVNFAYAIDRVRAPWPLSDISN